MRTYELNLDGLVGPTHHYAGLSLGNIASTRHARQTSNPQAGALQGLQKMRLLHKLGLKQAVLPPHARPDLHLLEILGFTGSPEKQLKNAYHTAPALLSACYSASSMWAANAATVSAAADTEDGKIHFTAANLMTNLHRSHEAWFSKKMLELIFDNSNYFQHHEPLPATLCFGDEGAANYNRLCESYDQSGLNLFVYGEQSTNTPFPRRQTRFASEAIARSHGLKPEHVFFAAQNPKAIDAGVFHNDVISVANESLFLVHQDAFIDQDQLFAQLKTQADFDLKIIQVPRSMLSLDDAVHTYLFNSQLITLSNQVMALIAPQECEEHACVNQLIQTWIQDAKNPIQDVHYLDLKQSMRNGGGPACLRLRIPLNDTALSAMHQGVLISDLLLEQLERWIKRHYRTELTLIDLTDPALIDEGYTALDELTRILKLGSIYSFQTSCPGNP